MPRFTGWKYLIGLGLISIMAVSFWTGYRGVDFGLHWDEVNYINTARLAHRHESVFPGWYYYPSASYYLGKVAIAPSSDLVYDATMINKPELYHIYLNGRKWFLFVSILFIPFLFLACRELGVSPLTSLFFTGIAALSFEFSYHSRWMVPDTVLFTPLVAGIWALLKYSNTRKQIWLYVSAVFAGLATGTKYNAAVLFLPVFITAISLQARGYNGFSLPRLFITTFSLIGIFILSFLLTTPGALFEFPIFYDAITFNWKHYRGEHSAHEVAGIADHLVKMVTYFSLELFSKIDFISILIFIAAILGMAWALVKKNIPLVILLSFPIVYFLLFLNLKVMIVRNYILLLPVFCLYAAWFADYFLQRSRTLAFGLALPALFILFSNGYEVYHASETIRRKEQNEYFEKELFNFVNTHTEVQFLFSSKMYNYWKYNLNKPIPNHVVSQKKMLDEQKGKIWVVFDSRDEEKMWRQFKSNLHDYTITQFGPEDINFNYYTESMTIRILVMDWKYAKNLEIAYF